MPTVDELKRCKFNTVLHGRLAKGGSIYQYRCVEFPRFTVSICTQVRGSQPHRSYVVDGEVLSTLEDVAKALSD